MDTQWLRFYDNQPKHAVVKDGSKNPAHVTFCGLTYSSFILGKEDSRAKKCHNCKKVLKSKGLK